MNKEKRINRGKILFVCLGNICRSPAAEGVMLQLVEKAGLADRFEIDSAGTYGGHAGGLPDARMREAATRRGYNLTHRSRKFKTNDFDRFDMIVVMDDSNYDNVRAMASTLDDVQKIVKMVDYCDKFDIDHVPDPYYGGSKGFDYVLDILENGCARLLDSLSE